MGCLPGPSGVVGIRLCGLSCAAHDVSRQEPRCCCGQGQRTAGSGGLDTSSGNPLSLRLVPISSCSQSLGESLCGETGSSCPGMQFMNIKKGLLFVLGKIETVH